MRWKVNEKHAELSECELITMKCIWDAGHEVSCAEIMEVLKNEYKLDYKDTTVYTFLKKLKEKGFVDSYRRGVTWFIPARDEDSYRAQQLRFTRDFWFKGSSSGLVSELLSLDELTPEERREIKELAEKLPE
jgi:predicted transcriptional regulator